MRTSASRWRDRASVRAQDGRLAVEVVPELGAKVASLVFGGRELLVQPAPGPVAAGRPTDYLRSGLCGWDEMLPTIVGAGLPDHGELWSRPAEVDVHDGAVRSRTVCTTVPLVFVRTLRLRGSAVLADYDVRNLSGSPVEALWAAHPQFVVDGSSRVSADGCSWQLVSGAARTADPVTGPLVEAVPAGGTAKWWSGQADRPAWVRLQDDRTSLTLSWSSGAVRHVGVWVDMAALADACAVSLQPSTSWHDDLHLARANGSRLLVPPRSVVSWQTRLDVRAA